MFQFRVVQPRHDAADSGYRSSSQFGQWPVSEAPISRASRRRGVRQRCRVCRVFVAVAAATLVVSIGAPSLLVPRLLDWRDVGQVDIRASVGNTSDYGWIYIMEKRIGATRIFATRLTAEQVRHTFGWRQTPIDDGTRDAPTWSVTASRAWPMRNSDPGSRVAADVIEVGVGAPFTTLVFARPVVRGEPRHSWPRSRLSHVVWWGFAGNLALALGIAATVSGALHCVRIWRWRRSRRCRECGYHRVGIGTRACPECGLLPRAGRRRSARAYEATVN